MKTVFSKKLTCWVARAFIAALVLAVGAPNAFAQADLSRQVPIQGRMSDGDTGEPIDGVVSVEFTLYQDAAGTDEAWTETQDVGFEDGFFTVYLGDETSIDPLIFADAYPVYLGVAVDGDEETNLIPLASTAFSGYADYCGVASNVSVDSPNVHDRYTDTEAIEAVGITYDEGVIEGPDFTLPTACAPGDVLRYDTDWRCVASVDVNNTLPDSGYLLYHETFERGTGGFSQSMTNLCNGNRILGGYNRFAGTSTTLSLDALPDHEQLRIQFDFYFIDSWDGIRHAVDEVATLSVDGADVWSSGPVDVNNFDNEIDELCASSEAAAERMDTIMVVVEHTSDTVELEFAAVLDSLPWDESWGLDNVVITIP